MKRLKNRYVVMLILMFCFTLSMSKVKAIDYSELNLAPGEEVVAETTKYYKTVTVISRSDLMIKANLGEISSITTEVTKEEYDNAPTDEELKMAPRDVYENYSTETAYKRLTSIITKYSNESYRYRAILEWKNIPKTRSYDIIGVGFYASVKVAATIDLINEYCRSANDCDETQGYYPYEGLNGGAAVFRLPSGTLTSLKQTLLVEVEKRNPSSTIVSQVCVADYSHATKSISYDRAKQFYVDTGGITLNGIKSYYDEMGTANAYWEGTW